MWKFKFNWDATDYDEENAYWLSRLSRMVYRERPGIERETRLFWNDPTVRFFEDVKVDAQCCLLIYPEGTLLAFRGTESFKDWQTNLKAGKKETGEEKVHSGFWNAVLSLLDESPKTYSARERDQMKDLPKPLTLDQELAAAMDSGKPLFICGHSLGGAMALLATYWVAQKLPGDAPLKTVYTWGQPRVGNKAFAETVRTSSIIRAYQHVNDRDIVPRVPPCRLGFAHVNVSHIYGDRG
ncbi:MAG: lipase family protein, partial [Verrucomicrobiae bacterium]|nr:lipase family protein [Verrucomicrobiae bacterium]